MSSVLGASAFTGLGLVVGGMLASLLGLLLVLGFSLARATGRARFVRIGSLARLTLFSIASTGMVMLGMEIFGLFGPRLPDWVDWLGAAWLVAFLATAGMILRRPHPSATASPDTTP